MTRLRKEINQEIADKLLLKDATVWQIVKRLGMKFWDVVSRLYKGHKQLVWEFMAGAGWALFIARYWGIL